MASVNFPLPSDETVGQVHMAYQFWRIIDFSMSVVVSVVATTMIGARLLLMERKMKRISKQSGGTFRPALPYRQILTLILESALPFTLIGVASAICIGAMDAREYTYRRSIHVFPFLMVLWTNALVSTCGMNIKIGWLAYDLGYR
jgi:hypothetical protein